MFGVKLSASFYVAGTSRVRPDRERYPCLLHSLARSLAAAEHRRISPTAQRRPHGLHGEHRPTERARHTTSGRRPLQRWRHRAAVSSVLSAPSAIKHAASAVVQSDRPDQQLRRRRISYSASRVDCQRG